MHWRDYRILMYFFTAAVIFSILSWVTLSPILTWAASIITAIVASGFILIGLGVNSLVLINRACKKIAMIGDALKNIEQTQEVIMKEQKEQGERSGAHSSIVPTLQAFSQLYFDHVNKTQSKGEE
ncbi:hypothetical protein ACFLXC_00380 [Chloroflexota bacterium]